MAGTEPTPAYDLDAERAYLGVLMNTPMDRVAEVLGLVEPGEMYRADHAEIQRAVAAVYGEDRLPDWLTVMHQMVEHGNPPEAGYLASCSQLAPYGSAGSWYATIIRRHARSRRLAESAARFSQLVQLAEPDRRDAALMSLLDGIRAELKTGDTALPRGAESALDWSTHLATDFHSIELLTDPLLGHGQQISLVGDGKVGKSLLAFEWALAMATGRPFLGNEPSEPRRLLYVDQENGHPEVQRRQQAMNYVEAAELKQLVYLSFPAIRPLDTPEGAADLLRLVDHYGPELVYFDTISRMVQGEENSADTWLSLYRLSIAPLKARGVATVRLDHFGKDPTRGARGNSTKSQDVDHVWELTAMPGGLLRLRRTHTRTGIGAGMLMLRRTGDPSERGTTRHERIVWGPQEQSRWTAERETIAKLDAAGVPWDAGRPTIRAWLKSEGIRMGTEQVDELIRFRRSMYDPQGTLDL